MTQNKPVEKTATATERVRELLIKAYEDMGTYPNPDVPQKMADDLLTKLRSEWDGADSTL